MEEAADKINQKFRSDESYNDRSRTNMILNGSLGEFPPKEKSEGHIGAFDGTLSIGVMVLPQILFLVNSLTI